MDSFEAEQLITATPSVDRAAHPDAEGYAARDDGIAAFTPAESRTQRALRLVLLALGAALLVVSSAAVEAEPASAVPAQAPKSAAASRSAPAVSAPAMPDYNGEISAAIVPLLADGMRLESVTLACKPPPGAVLQAVAPGVARIQSRGIVVEFNLGGRKFACGATIDAQRQVLVAAHDIAPNQPLRDKDFTPQWVDAFGSAPSAAASFPQPGPYNSTTMLRRGQPLYPTELARPLAVNPGDQVTVVIRNGAVTVRTQLEARTPAAVGESATMINPMSGNPVVVTVTGLKTAELVMQ